MTNLKYFENRQNRVLDSAIIEKTSFLVITITDTR